MTLHDLPPRIAAKIRVNDATGCWEWTASRNAKGYGTVSRQAYGENLAHRLTYRLLVGPIPEGMECDHLCRVHECVLPLHLEPVPHVVNVQRGMAGAAYRLAPTCIRGHAWTPETTRFRTNGGRVCIECARQRHRESYVPKPRPEHKLRQECRWGHAMTPENILPITQNGRVYAACRACGRIRSRNWQRKNRRVEPDRFRVTEGDGLYAAPIGGAR